MAEQTTNRLMLSLRDPDGNTLYVVETRRIPPYSMAILPVVLTR